ncbi:MAG: DUF3168 domain-containing protein [Pseudomonadota bacterium]|nr:DUF3168 domain-containing protein [Pseudomonadota bacterium]
MPDVVAAIVALLLADADVAGQVGARGFGGELPADETASMPRKAFVVRASGGASLTGGSFAEVDAQRLDVFTFGATPAEAGALSDLISLKLRRVERTVSAQTLIHWVKSAGGYSSGREPVTEWPRTFRSFQVLHALGPVPGVN